MPGQFRYVLDQLNRAVHIASRPEQIAGGVALGTFLSFALPPGVQILVALGLAPLFRVNPIAASAAVWITNPVTMPFIYPAALWLGAWVTGVPVFAVLPEEDQALMAYLTDFASHGRAIILLYFGLLCMGSLGALTSYLLTLGVLRKRAAKSVNAAANERKANHMD